ncbi:Protein PET100, mitochondrial [Portunus trituberculatus]|uniref:Protein PET100, mitochondrial n=1 Tax=Portunus trituberculatus TaxID=210409 RepID=A0A5B7HAC5_PORTR|nr:Protein PET100, mitochondrial [Portunus trituberculatus]
MGGWKLEIGKMAMYMSFPVMLFYVFNQPKYFEEWTVRMRRELYPPLDKMHNEGGWYVLDKVDELDKVVSMGSGRHPCMGSNPTTCRLETLSFVKWFKVTYMSS